MSVKIYIDTNIYLNSILNRDKNISRDMFIFLSEMDVELYLNDLSIMNIHYIIRKKFDRDFIKKELKMIQSEHNLVSIDREIIENALDSEFKDFEDGVQYFCAKSVNAELIITDNKKDFKHSEITIISAREFYEKYMS